MKTLGQINYEAYREHLHYGPHCNWPVGWGRLTAKEQEAWEEGAHAVALHVHAQILKAISESKTEVVDESREA